MLEVRSLRKSFGGRPVLEGLDLDLPRGECLALAGPSGCGKSTLLHLLAGLVPPDGGTMRLEGREVPSLRGRCALMAQDDRLLPWMDLLDNALLPVRMRGEDPRRREGEARELLDRFGLGEFLRYPPGSVSGGMRQRCALVRTLLWGCPLVLLDEPLSALDAFTRRTLQEEVLRLQGEWGRTLLWVTHDLEEALRVGDRVWVLGPGMTVRDRLTPRGPKPRPVDGELAALRERAFRALEGVHV